MSKKRPGILVEALVPVLLLDHADHVVDEHALVAQRQVPEPPREAPEAKEAGDGQDGEKSGERLAIQALRSGRRGGAPYRFSMIAEANSDVLRSFAPSICRSKS